MVDTVERPKKIKRQVKKTFQLETSSLSVRCGDHAGVGHSQKASSKAMLLAGLDCRICGWRRNSPRTPTRAKFNTVTNHAKAIA